MSIFEIGMMVCWGVSWPTSIWKLWKAKRSDGKSVRFAVIVIIGYLCGIMHKVIYNLDPVIGLYIINTIMVAIDLYLILYYRNSGK